MEDDIVNSIRYTCGNCKVTYTIKYNEEETDMKPMSCPFCSYEVDEEDDIGDENEETSWD